MKTSTLPMNHWKKIQGFKGLIDQVVWISTSDIGVITNHGFFIVNLSDNSNVIKFHIAWSHGFYIDVVAVDLEKKTVYVLSLSGQLRSMSFDKNVICETDSMDVVIEKGCLSVQYFADLKLLTVLDCHGIWALSSETGVWTLLFKVCPLSFVKF